MIESGCGSGGTWGGMKITPSPVLHITAIAPVIAAPSYWLTDLEV